MTGEKMNTLLGMKWDDVSEIDKSGIYVYIAFFMQRNSREYISMI